MNLNHTLILTAQADCIDSAMREMRTAVPTAKISAELAPGVLCIDLNAETFENLAATWRVQPPIFVRHICPVEEMVVVDDHARPVPRLQSALMPLLVQIVPDRHFSIQTRVFGEGLPFTPFDLNNPLAELVRTVRGAPLDVRHPAQVISINLALIKGELRAYIGISNVLNNLSEWAGGVRRLARDPDQISRAEFKLTEALETFEISLPSRGIALDLGAAPGGWTRVLRKAGLYVTAVDPAALDERIAHDSGVRHLRITTETFLQREPEQFDLILNDMRQDARDSARMMASCAPLMREGGTALMTLKLPEHGRDAAVDHALNILRRAYRVAGARQLFHNRSEITVWLAPSDGGSRIKD